MESQNEQSKTLERVPDSTPLSEIKPIQESGALIFTREELSKWVEAPLLEACEELYDKNIETVMTSANGGENREVYIDIVFDSLSEENKKIALQFGEPFIMRGFKPQQGVKITIPSNEHSTVGDIRKRAHEAVAKFKPQEMTWAITYTLDQLRKSYMKPNLIPTDLPDYFYDKESGLFYLSKEHFDKVKNSKNKT